ncbi:ATP-binding protein [Dinoroseobacter sp. PD6]|uniref:ATP-binding protein n=2 Tax=Pseudomonadota TaxID=1224 RepID=UPI00237B4243|nr:ATP-binding protein [Dinoroseobacter sp. PD6]MDD9718245.1 ATP-binding protein [Dinoroseobacter sp. PD6]
MSNSVGIDRKEFRNRLDYLLHPSRHIELAAQLKGREKTLAEMLDAFETPGAHPFIWGARGIGKTSVGHTACIVFDNVVELRAAVACGKDTSFRSLLQDILDASTEKNPSILKSIKAKGQFSFLGLTIAGETLDLFQVGETISPNQAASLIDRVIVGDDVDLTPCLIIDEFDRLENDDTFQCLSDMLKQMSVRNSRAKIIFCGVTRDLDDLLSAHESIDRYVQGVELAPLSHDAIWEIVTDVEEEFGVSFHKGQRTRISQISCGYPHFAHLILKSTLLRMFEDKISTSNVSDDLFKSALNNASDKAATRLRTAYDSAVQKGTDRYIELLFALANGPHLAKQFKQICTDYEEIMKERPERPRYNTIKNNGQDIRNALESLSKRRFLRKSRSGWYEFTDPMLRGYVRLQAEKEGIELGDSHFGA